MLTAFGLMSIVRSGAMLASVLVLAHVGAVATAQTIPIDKVDASPVPAVGQDGAREIVVDVHDVLWQRETATHVETVLVGVPVARPRGPVAGEPPRKGERTRVRVVWSGKARDREGFLMLVTGEASSGDPKKLYDVYVDNKAPHARSNVVTLGLQFRKGEVMPGDELAMKLATANEFERVHWTPDKRLGTNTLATYSDGSVISAEAHFRCDLATDERHHKCELWKAQGTIRRNIIPAAVLAGIQQTKLTVRVNGVDLVVDMREAQKIYGGDPNDAVTRFRIFRRFRDSNGNLASPCYVLVYFEGHSERNTVKAWVRVGNSLVNKIQEGPAIALASMTPGVNTRIRTATPHGLVNGDWVWLKGVSAKPEKINQFGFQVTVISSTEFDITTDDPTTVANAGNGAVHKLLHDWPSARFYLTEAITMTLQGPADAAVYWQDAKITQYERQGSAQKWVLQDPAANSTWNRFPDGVGHTLKMAWTYGTVDEQAQADLSSWPYAVQQTERHLLPFRVQPARPSYIPDDQNARDRLRWWGEDHMGANAVAKDPFFKAELANKPNAGSGGSVEWAFGHCTGSSWTDTGSPTMLDVAIRDGYQEGTRPSMFYELDGTRFLSRAHPDTYFWGARPHTHPTKGYPVTTDPLGKTNDLPNALLPRNRRTQHYAPLDGQHWSTPTLYTTYSITRDVGIGEILLNYVECIKASQDPRNDVSKNPYRWFSNPRQECRSMMEVCRAYRMFHDDECKAIIKERLEVSYDKGFFGQPGMDMPFSARWQPGSQASNLRTVYHSVTWQDAILTHTFWAMQQIVPNKRAVDRLYGIAEAVVRYGYYPLEDDRQLIDVLWDNDVPLPEEGKTLTQPSTGASGTILLADKFGPSQGKTRYQLFLKDVTGQFTARFYPNGIPIQQTGGGTGESKWRLTWMTAAALMLKENGAALTQAELDEVYIDPVVGSEFRNRLVRTFYLDEGHLPAAVLCQHIATQRGDTALAALAQERIDKAYEFRETNRNNRRWTRVGEWGSLIGGNDDG